MESIPVRFFSCLFVLSCLLRGITNVGRHNMGSIRALYVSIGSGQSEDVISETLRRANSIHAEASNPVPRLRDV